MPSTKPQHREENGGSNQNPADHSRSAQPKTIGARTNCIALRHRASRAGRGRRVARRECFFQRLVERPLVVCKRAQLAARPFHVRIYSCSHSRERVLEYRDVVANVFDRVLNHFISFAKHASMAKGQSVIQIIVASLGPGMRIAMTALE